MGNREVERYIREEIMDKSETLSRLKELVNFLISEYKPERIMLFGSYGTEMSHKNSDIDLLIIKDTNKRFIDRMVKVMRLIRSRFGFKYPVEPLIYTPDEFRKAKQINSIFIRTILSKGIILYGKE